MLLLVTFQFLSMNDGLSKVEILEALQKEILDLQGLHAPLESERRDTGLGILNDAFPNGCFPFSAVHEFVSATKETAAATSGFITGLLSAVMSKGACLWVSSGPMVFPPALSLFNIVPDQVVFAQVADGRKRLWVIEEALKCEALSAVVGEVSELTFTESRRLQLAVEKSHVTGFIHRHTQKAVNNVACVSRWNVRPMASITEENMPGIGFFQWQVELQKIRNGKPGSWTVQWTDTGFKVIDDKASQQSIVIPIRKTG